LGLASCEVAGAGGGIAQAAAAHSMVEVSGLALPGWARDGGRRRAGHL